MLLEYLEEGLSSGQVAMDKILREDVCGQKVEFV